MSLEVKGRVVTRTDFNRLQQKDFPQIAQATTAENRYWKRFKFPAIFQEFGTVTDVCFQPVPRGASTSSLFALNASTKVQIYSAQSRKVVRSITKFEDDTYGCNWRDDGTLLAAGSETGVVKVFDSMGRSVLRSFNAHQRACHVACFASQAGSSVFSGSDDGRIKVLDIPSEAVAWEVRAGHSDRIRGGRAHPQRPEIFITGSYDGTAKLWDTRQNWADGPVMTMQHNDPIDDIIFLPGSTMVATAGQHDIKIWNTIGTSKLFTTLRNHQKNVTCLALDGTGSRLLSGGLDSCVKIYALDTFNVVHTLTYSAPVLSVAMDRHSRFLVAGMADGNIHLSHRPNAADRDGAKTKSVVTGPLGSANTLGQYGDLTFLGARGREAKKSLRAGTYRYFMRQSGERLKGGPGLGSLDADNAQQIFVTGGKRQKLKAYDQMLKRFRYRDALDTAMNEGKSVMVISVMEELARRRGLGIALSGRDDAALEPILHFLQKNIANPRFARFLIDVSRMVIDIYRDVVGLSPAIDEQFLKLRDRIRSEVKLQQELTRFLGVLEMTGCAAERK
eukprot:Clim_evm62s147 gene=Clim_evmTU62s147